MLISLGGLAVTAAIQAYVVVLSGSVALLGDTLHNVADALTAVPLLIAFRLARRAPTKKFTAVSCWFFSANANRVRKMAALSSHMRYLNSAPCVAGL